MTKTYQIVDVFYAIVNGELRFPIEHMVMKDGVFSFPVRTVSEKPKVELTSRLLDVICVDSDTSDSPEHETWMFATEVSPGGDFLTTSSYLITSVGLSKHITRKLKSIQRKLRNFSTSDFSDIQCGTHNLNDVWAVCVSYVNNKLVINRGNSDLRLHRNDILNGMWFTLNEGDELVGVRIVSHMLVVSCVWDDFTKEV